MSINDYNIDQQIKLIKLAEFIIDRFDSRSGEDLIDGGWDSEDFVRDYEVVRDKVAELFPELLDEENEIKD